jgi:hypothetical protein
MARAKEMLKAALTIRISVTVRLNEDQVRSLHAQLVDRYAGRKPHDIVLVRGYLCRNVRGRAAILRERY